MLFRRAQIILILSMSVIGLVSPLRAEDKPVGIEDKKAAFSMTIEEFGKLSAADQKAVLAGAFEHRLRHARNIHYEAKLRGGNYEYKDGQIGKRVANLNGSNIRHWRLGDVYRVDTDRGGPDVTKAEQMVSSGFDPAKGEGRGTVRSPSSPRVFARIDSQVDTIVETNRYEYWLDGTHTKFAEYLIRYLADHKGSYTIELPAGENLVRLSVPWQVRGSDKPLGTREFVLDPTKGFLAVSGKARWETAGGKNWRTEVFTVEESQLVGDVWMPTKLKELIGGASLGAKVVNVWETTVTKIEAGKVTAKDVEIPFPKGAEVVDAIKGIAYVVGDNGEPTKVEQLVRGEAVTELPPDPTPPSSSSERWRWLILTSTIVIVGVGIVLARRNASKSPTPAAVGPLSPTTASSPQSGPADGTADHSTTARRVRAPTPTDD
jgi:hypothetical protein